MPDAYLLFCRNRADSLYERLYKCIRNDILCGNLSWERNCRPNEILENLGISTITVENAYASS